MRRHINVLFQAVVESVKQIKQGGNESNLGGEFRSSGREDTFKEVMFGQRPDRCESQPLQDWVMTFLDTCKAPRWE